MRTCNHVKLPYHMVPHRSCGAASKRRAPGRMVLRSYHTQHPDSQGKKDNSKKMLAADWCITPQLLLSGSALPAAMAVHLLLHRLSHLEQPVRSAHRLQRAQRNLLPPALCRMLWNMKPANTAPSSRPVCRAVVSGSACCKCGGGDGLQGQREDCFTTLVLLTQSTGCCTYLRLTLVPTRQCAQCIATGRACMVLSGEACFFSEVREQPCTAHLPASTQRLSSA